jgi:hypothetical protein
MEQTNLLAQSSIHTCLNGGGNNIPLLTSAVAAHLHEREAAAAWAIPFIPSVPCPLTLLT